MRSRRVGALALASVIVLATACSPASSPATSVEPGSTASVQPSASTTLKFAWHETDPLTVAYIEEAAAEYKTTTGVEVSIDTQPSGDTWTKLQATISVGKPYDLATIDFAGRVGILASRDALEPLDDVIDGLGRDDFLPESLVEYEGADYFLPYDYNIGTLYIRTDWLAEAGLESPKTWDELLNVAKTLHRQDRAGLAFCFGSPGCNTLMWSPLLFGNGVELFNDEWNVILDTPDMKAKTVEVLNYTKEFVPYMPAGAERNSYDELLNLFSTGQVAVAPWVGRLAHAIEVNSPDIKDSYTVIGFPTKDGSPPTGGLAIDGIVVPKGPNSAAAKDFLAWFAKEKMAGFNALIPTHLLPTRASIFEDPVYRDSAEATRLWDVAIAPQYELVQSGRVFSIESQGPTTDARTSAVQDAGIIRDMVLGVLLKDTPPEQAVDEAAARIRDIMEP